MSYALQSTTALLDIEPPALPAKSDFASVLTGFTLLIILIFFIVLAIRKYISPRSKAKRCLQQLKKNVKNNNRQIVSSHDGTDDAKDISYQLARILATGIGLNGITLTTRLPVELKHQQQRWQQFTGDLSAARYDHNYSRPASQDKLFKETLFFLKKWP